MKEATRQNLWGNEMSATVLSAFYDMDMLYKVTAKFGAAAAAEARLCLY